MSFIEKWTCVRRGFGGQFQVFFIYSGLTLMASLSTFAEEPQAEKAPVAVAPALVQELKWLRAESIEIEIPNVYGVSRFAQSSVQAPSAVTVIRREQIQKFGYRTLGDVLRSLRGFTTTYDRTIEFVGMRGFNNPSDINSRILVLVDDHRINDNLFDAGVVGTEFPLDVGMIERIEIIRGPVSSLYGSNAFLGTIKVITRNGEGLNGVEASAGYGSFDEYKGRVSFGKVFENGLDLVLSGTFKDNPGSDSIFLADFDDPATNNGIANTDRDKNIYFNGKLSYMDFTFAGSYGKREKQDPSGQFADFNDLRTLNTDEHYYLDLTYNHTFGDDWGLTARAYYDYYSYDGIFPVGGVVNVTEDVGQWWGTELSVTKTLFELHKVVVGAEFRDNFNQELVNFDTDPTVLFTDVHEDSDILAFYFQDQYEIFDNLILNAGFRYDRYSTFGDTTNPRAAIIYNPLSKTILKFLYGEAFRAPNAFELLFDDGLFLTANPNLKPESIRTYEAILEQYIARNYRLTLAAFHIEIEDVIISEQDPGDPTGNATIFENRGSHRSQGVEIEFEATWKTGLEGRVSYSYQDTVDKDTGAVLPNAPHQLGKLNLVIPVVSEKLFAGIEVQYVDTRKTVLPGSADDYWLTNLTLFSHKVIEGLDFTASVYNVFNDLYEDVVADSHLQTVLRNDGRTFFLQLTYNF